MTGAAIATVASYAFVSAALYLNARKAVRLNFGFLKLGRIIIAAAIMGIAAWLVQPEQALAKAGTIIAGAALYFGLLFALCVFTKEEKGLLASVLPKPLRRLAQWLSN
jgi:peptidoglycan biosynthesis protein MviN/MurJ (putative lipid II flippase)